MVLVLLPLVMPVWKFDIICCDPSLALNGFGFCETTLLGKEKPGWLQRWDEPAGLLRDPSIGIQKAQPELLEMWQ